MDIGIESTGGSEVGVSGDLANTITNSTTNNYESTKDTIDSFAALLDEMKEKDPLLNKAAKLLFKEFDRREARIDSLVSENRKLWAKLHQLENALTISNKNNDAGLIRERAANAKIEALEEDIDNCPSLRLKAAVASLLIFALTITPIVAVLSFLVYTGK